MRASTVDYSAAATAFDTARCVRGVLGEERVTASDLARTFGGAVSYWTNRLTGRYPFTAMDLHLIGLATRRHPAEFMGGERATLPLHPLVAEVAVMMPRRGWWFPSPANPMRPIARTSCSDGIRRAMHRLGVPGSGHQLRHWHASALLAAGVDVRVVQTLMRHSSLATTAIYTRVSASMQRDAVALLPVFDWSPALHPLRPAA